MTPLNSEIAEIISSITPFDELEAKHINDAVTWINSGVEIFRIQKPDKPPKHIVCYTVLFDQEERKLLLLEHKKALLLLPSGGHPEPGELPHLAAIRELKEELDKDAEFILPNQRLPFFITQVVTVGLTAGHIDVDLWYLLKGDSSKPFTNLTEDFLREFGNYGWYTLDEILKMPIEKLDPHMHRFVKKLIEAYPG